MRRLLLISLGLGLFVFLFLVSFSATAEKLRILVQSSPLAGSQYYAVAEFVHKMQLGDALTLIREPDNRYDRLAVRVEWQGHKLGYVPRRENRRVAQALDQDEQLEARISALREHNDPWQRVEFEIYLAL